NQKKMLPYFLGAYFGGRIQPLQIGEHHKVVTHDIISAYPAAMIQLPSALGTWRKTNSYKPNHQWACYFVSWNLPPSTLIAPFPVRAKLNHSVTINYPLAGSGLYWQPEIAAALAHYCKHIEIHYGFYFTP